MRSSEFWNHVTEMNSMSGRGSTGRKQEELQEMITEYDLEESYWALRFIVGNPLEDWEGDVGAKKKTVRETMVMSYNAKYDQIRDIEKDKGDLSRVCGELDRPDGLTNREDALLSEVGQMVEDISETSGNAKISLIAEKIGEMEKPQVLIFAMLNDLSFGVGVATIKDAIAAEYRVTREELDCAHGLTPDISRLYRQVIGAGTVMLDIEVYDRIKPQKARDGSMPDGEGGLISQVKYDGGRTIIHSKDGEIRAFSRNQKEVTENLLELQEVEWPDVDFIVDAEAVGYDPETGEPLPFQSFMTRFQREHNIQEQMNDVEIKFKCFDLLYLNGDDLTDLPYRQRWNKMINRFPKDILAYTGEHAESVYEWALENGHEGIIVKNKEAPYHFKRSSTWKKVKPVKEPIEVVVSGVIQGTGKYAGTLGSLKVETGDGTPLGRVGTGFKDHQRDELWEMFQQDDLEGKTIELEFEELQQKGDRYGLRFPRYSGLRPEGEADTLERIKNL